MISLCEVDQCTGCSACANICPFQCIEMQSDERGFLIPQIKTEKCVECGKCRKVCPVLNPVLLNEPKQVLAACSRDIVDRDKSASGGLASVFYKEILQNGGIAYGVVMNEDHYAVYERIENEKQIDFFRGSKYTGSLMNDVYLKVRKDLKNNKKVLFIGMSCQIAGLLNFLEEKYKENLLVIDILCHGMPSHKYFKEYIEILENKKGEKIKEISFRDNNIFRLKCQFSDSSYERKGRYDGYYAGYTSMLFYRDSCYSCPYATIERNSDITLADFWGCEKEENLQPAEKGISMVLLNTEKGERFFQAVEKDINYVEKTVEKALQTNEQLNRPSPIHELRGMFMQVYAQEGFEQASKKVIRKVIVKNRIQWGKRFIKRGLAFPYRKGKIILKKVGKIFGKKNIGVIVRKYWRNRYERNKLLNTDFTILSNTCIGGIISHDMGLKFLSPTINLYIRPQEFVKLISDLDYYLSLEMVEIQHPAPYPVAMLGDITLYLKHYETFEDAKKKWEERCERINKNKIYLMMTDRDFSPPDKKREACDKTVLEAFDKLPYKKVCFTGCKYENLHSCKAVSKNKDGDCVNIITDIVSYSGKRLYQYADQFDYIEWLND